MSSSTSTVIDEAQRILQQGINFLFSEDYQVLSETSSDAGAENYCTLVRTKQRVVFIMEDGTQYHVDIKVHKTEEKDKISYPADEEAEVELMKAEHKDTEDRDNDEPEEEEEEEEDEDDEIPPSQPHPKKAKPA